MGKDGYEIMWSSQKPTKEARNRKKNQRAKAKDNDGRRGGRSTQRGCFKHAKPIRYDYGEFVEPKSITSHISSLIAPCPLKKKTIKAD